MEMNAKERYDVMLENNEVSTSTFHEVFGALLDEGTNEDAIDHMNTLLHIPKFGPIQWEQNAIRLAGMRMISTVTEEEALSAYLPLEDPQEWDVLAKRIVEKRRLS